MSSKVLEWCLFCFLFPTRELTEETYVIFIITVDLWLWWMSAGSQAEFGG